MIWCTKGSPKLPTLVPNDSRLLPQTFEGGLLESRDLPGLTFSGGRLEKTKKRESNDFEDLAMSIKGKSFPAPPIGEHFDLAGGD